MPQPPVDIHKYFNQALPRIADKYPPGTGGTGARKDWDENLTGVEVIDNFADQVTKCA